MKINGQATFHAPVERVWTALNDPAVLARTIPGCERLEATGEDSYRMVVTAGVAAIKGRYAGDVRLAELRPPSSFVMTASGAGAPGTVTTNVRVALSDAGDGSTSLTYDAEADVGGVLAGVGQRMLAGVGKRLAAEFFGAVDDVLTARPGRDLAEPAPAADGSTTAPATDSGVYLAPGRGLGPDTSRVSGDGFVPGAVVGAASMLAGVLVGWLLGRRPSCGR